MWFLDFFVQLLITVSLINHQFQRLLKPDGFRAPKSWTDPVQEHWPIISCNAELQICKLGLHPGISKAVGSTTKSVTAFRPVCIVILVGSAHVSGQLGHWWGDKDVVSAELTCCEWFVCCDVCCTWGCHSKKYDFSNFMIGTIGNALLQVLISCRIVLMNLRILPGGPRADTNRSRNPDNFSDVVKEKVSTRSFDILFFVFV